jgi:hypothetical protein
MLRENHQADTAANRLQAGSHCTGNRLAAGFAISDAEFIRRCRGGATTRMNP